MRQRKAIEEDLLKLAGEMTPGGGNRKIYENLFKAMNDNQFTLFWNQIKERGYLPIYVDQQNPKEDIVFDYIVKLAKENNVPLEQNVVYVDPENQLTITTPETAIVGIAEVRKQRQLITKKISISKNDYEAEDLTGQPTGESKAGGISNPEIGIVVALGLPNMAMELADVRGGDKDAFRQYKTDIITTGTSSVKSALKNGSGVKSLSTAHYLLRGQHLDNNLNER